MSLERARTIMRAALESGRALKLKPLAVVVLDAGGHVQAFEREDGAAPGRFAIAHGKAYGAVMLGMAGTARVARRGCGGAVWGGERCVCVYGAGGARGRGGGRAR